MLDGAIKKRIFMELVESGHALRPPHMQTSTIPRASSHDHMIATMGENRFAPHRSLERSAELDITLFVACYNEEKNILDTLENLRSTMLVLPFTYEIIVIDDASSDRSVLLVEKFQQDHPEMAITLVRNPANRGLSRNFAEGAFLGRGRYYKLICGDNVDDRDSLLATLNHIGRPDLIIPYHREIHGRSWARRSLSRTYTRLVNLLSGQALNYYNGCPVFHRVDVMRWHSRSSGFGFQAELLTCLLREGATYVEVPIVGKERPGGVSTAMKLKNWISVGATLLTIFIQRLRSR